MNDGREPRWPARPEEAPRVDLLAIAAHPDDAELLCGGTLAKAARQGYRVAILDLTRGESGSYGSVERRAEEARAAARMLGLVARATVGLPDAALENTPSTRLAVAAWVRAFRPRTVVLPFPGGRHPDHHVAADLARDACFVAGLRRVPAPLPPFRPTKLLYALAFREDAPPPRFVVDITDTIETKLAAISCYASQIENRTWIGEVFPGGDRPLLEQIRVHAAAAGARIRTAYGEPFLTLEALRVDDVVALPGRSL